MKKYMLQTEAPERWGDEAENGMIITESELNRFAAEWDKDVEDLLNDLVEVEDDPHKTPREMLQDAQDMLGLNQKELGVYIGVSTRTINSWMTGERQCPDYVAELTLRIAAEDNMALIDDEPTSGMMRWAVIDEKQGGDEFLTVCGSKADALREAAKLWDYMTAKEKERCSRFQVALIHVQLIDENVDRTRFSYYISEPGAIADADVYELAKEYK